ncbi:MAG TPA: hypothetical protein VGF21_04105 [Thermoleophilaceae bacterium]
MIFAALALSPSALAGRLVESGHDADYHCITSPANECGFVKAGLNYVRAAAPSPSKPILILDRGGLLAQQSVNKVYGHCPGTNCTVVDPRSGTFNTTPIDTAHWSAVYVASDVNCGGCDLNDPIAGGVASTPDSTAIAARTDDISAFFNAGGGLMVGAGAADAGGFTGAPTFSSPNEPYYSFVATAGADNANPPFSLTSLGAHIGLTSGDINCSLCFTHNSFGFPPAGSQLHVAERDASGRFVTLVEDSDNPVARVLSGPSGGAASSSATFTFSANEPGSFQCSVDTGSYGACTSPKTVSGLPDGRHTFNVRAIDLVGNVQPTPASSSWCQPGGKEVPGNKVDEDCNGFSAPFDSVEASIRFAFRFTRRSTTVSSMNLSKVTSRSKLKVTCRGKGCPFKSKSVKLKKGRAKLSKIFRKHRRKAKLRRGARIRVSLTKKGLISKVYEFKVRRAAVPNFATRCQTPGSSKLRARCPSFK